MADAAVKLELDNHRLEWTHPRILLGGGAPVFHLLRIAVSACPKCLHKGVAFQIRKRIVVLYPVHSFPFGQERTKPSRSDQIFWEAAHHLIGIVKDSL